MRSLKVILEAIGWLTLIFLASSIVTLFGMGTYFLFAMSGLLSLKVCLIVWLSLSLFWTIVFVGYIIWSDKKKESRNTK